MQASRKKKVSFIVSAFPPQFTIGGGVAKRYGRTVQAFGNQGYETHVLTYIRHPTTYKNMTVHSFPSINMPLSCTVVNILDDIPRVQRIIQGSEMVFVDDTPGGGIVCCIANNMGIRAIKTNHTHAAAFTPLFVAKLWLVMDGGKEVPYATTSTEYARYIEDTYHVPVRMVWPQILWSDLFYTWTATERVQIRQRQRETWRQQLLPEDQDKFIVFNAGRLSPEKRIDLLMDSIPETAVLIVHGDGLNKHKRPLRAKAERTARCYFLPQYLSAETLRSAYFGCDLFVSASDMETNGLTVVEAIACQTPVAVYPAKGHLESVQDGENGWYVNFEDAAIARQQLTDCLRKGQPASLNASSKRIRASQSDAQLVAYLEVNVPPVRPNVPVPSTVLPRAVLYTMHHRRRILLLISLVLVLAAVKCLKK